MKPLFTFSLFCTIQFLNVHTLPVDVKQTDSSFQISVIHLNDFHARFEEITDSSSTCKSTDTKCIGGIARLYTAVTELLQSRPTSLFINAGDNFQGTLWYNIFKWNVTQEFLNKFPTDVYTLGNHEFDSAIEGVVPFIKSLNAPVVVANIDATDEPDILGSFNKSVIIEKNGTRIGIIGVLLSSTPKMSQTENLVFLPESASVNEEADRLVSEEDIDTIIVVSHCGYDLDKEIAANASRKIGLIVGAHSHTFLYTGDDPPGPDTPAGDYPTVIEHQDGRKILIVQASAYTKYLGNITVYYDSNGDVVDWSGAPIYLDNYTKDATIEEELQPWKEVVDAYGSVVVGATEIDLPQDTCYFAECLMANVVADSMAHSYQGTNDLIYPPIGIINAGGVRIGLTAGNITYADAVQVVPFENVVQFGTLQGKYLLQALEETSDDSILHFSYGLHVNYSSDMKVLSAEVYCSGCSSPSFVPLSEDESYLVMFPSYFSTSGVYTSIYTNMTDQTSGLVDSEALTSYLADNNPITSVDTGRLTIFTDEGGDEESGGEEGEEGEGDSGISKQKPALFVLLLALIGNYVYSFL